MARMDKKWVVMCSTAVAAVYASGYFTTASQAANIEPQQQTQSNVQRSISSPYTGHSRHRHWDDESSTSKSNYTADSGGEPNSQSNNQASGQYKDGTYTGQGMNRRGSIEVTVKIKSNKITDVEISSWGMHYGEGDVDGLPQEVVQTQSAQVQNVSGATYSTEAFQDAVQDALTKANA